MKTEKTQDERMKGAIVSRPALLRWFYGHVFVNGHIDPATAESYLDDFMLHHAVAAS